MKAPQSLILRFIKENSQMNTKARIIELYTKDQIMELFEKLKDLDSRVFFEIPQKTIKEAPHYRFWFLQTEKKWMTEFNNRNSDHFVRDFWNDTRGGIQGYFGDDYISHCKLYRFDATKQGWSDDDFRAKRGLLIQDHYSSYDVVKVHIIADNLEAFLKQEKIAYKRTNLKK